MWPNLCHRGWDWGWDRGWDWGQGGQDRVWVWRQKNSSQSGKKTSLQRRLNFVEDFISLKIHFREDFISDKISFQRRLGTLETVFELEMKSECIQSQPRLPRVGRRPRVSEKTSFQRRLGTLENFFQSGNEEWIYSKPTTPLKSLKTTTSFREDFISENIGYTWERFHSGKWRVNVFKANHAF